MFFCEGVTVQDSYTRWGATKTLNVTAAGKDMFSDFKYNSEAEAVEVTAGDCIVVLAKEFGVHETSHIEVITVKDNILVKLLEGVIYVKSAQGQVIRITADGQTELFNGFAGKKEKKLKWFNLDELELMTTLAVHKIYNISISEKRTSRYYLDNLVFTIQIGYDGSTLSCNCYEAVEALGVTGLTVQETVDEAAYTKKRGNAVEEDLFDDDDEDGEDLNEYLDESDFEEGDFDDIETDDEY